MSSHERNKKNRPGIFSFNFDLPTVTKSIWFLLPILTVGAEIFEKDTDVRLDNLALRAGHGVVEPLVPHVGQLHHVVSCRPADLVGVSGQIDPERPELIIRIKFNWCWWLSC